MAVALLLIITCVARASALDTQQDLSRQILQPIDPRHHYYLQEELVTKPTKVSRIERPAKRQESKLPTPTHNAQGALLCAPGSPCIDGR